MPTARDPYFFEKVALGLIPGATRVQLRGYNAAISNSTETVWTAGATYAQLTSPTVLEVVSASANDAAAGTGARTISVTTINSARAISTQTVTMNGTNAVDLTGTHYAVLEAKVLTSGSGLVNAGNITIRVDGAGATKATISTAAIAQGRTADFIYTIPSGYVGLLKDIDWSVTGATGTVTVTLIEIDTSGNRRTLSSSVEGVSNTSITRGNGNKISHGAGLLIDENIQIELRALASTGAGALTAMGELFLFDRSANTFGL